MLRSSNFRRAYQCDVSEEITNLPIRGNWVKEKKKARMNEKKAKKRQIRKIKEERASTSKRYQNSNDNIMGEGNPVKAMINERKRKRERERERRMDR